MLHLCAHFGFAPGAPGALPFFEVSVERDSSGYPDGLSLARGTAITHSPDVIDVAHPYILVQDSTEGYSSIDLLAYMLLS